MTILSKAEDARTQAAKIKVNDKTSNAALATVKADINAIIAEAKPAPVEPPSPPAPEPEPTPPPTPTEKPIFEGKKIGDFAEDQSAPGAWTEGTDPLGSGEPVLVATVHEKDVAPITPTENPRAQLVAPADLRIGEEFWLRSEFLLPANFPVVSPGAHGNGWLTLLSFYGPPFQGAGPWCVEIGPTSKGDELRWQRNGSYSEDIPWSVPTPRGKWTTILLHAKLAKDGFVEMWVDGQPVTFFSASPYNPKKVQPTSRLTMATADATNSGGANSVRVVQYRELGMPGFKAADKTGATVYFRPTLVGKTRASVGG